MFVRIRRRLTFANVCSFLALMLALGTGTAYAANTIGSKDIINGQVKMVDLGNNAVTTNKVLDGTLTSSDLAADSVGVTQISAGGVGSSEIADGSVGTADVASNSLTTADLLGADVNGANISLGSNSVPNGQCKDFLVTIGGAHAGEAVVFSLKATPPQGMLLYGVNVPADNQVTLKVCNLTGGTSPAITNLPVRVVTFG